MGKKITSEDLKVRVAAAKKELPTGGLTSLFVFLYPKYGPTGKLYNKMINVIQLRQADETITNMLEDVAQHLKDYNNVTTANFFKQPH